MVGALVSLVRAPVSLLGPSAPLVGVPGRLVAVLVPLVRESAALVRAPVSLVRPSASLVGASASLADASARAPRYHPVSRVGSDACGDEVAAEWVPWRLLAPAARGSGDVIILGGSTSRGPVRSPRPGRRLCFATPCLPLRRPPAPGVSFARRRGGAAALNLARRPAVGKPLHRHASRGARTRAITKPGWCPGGTRAAAVAVVARSELEANARLRHSGTAARQRASWKRCSRSRARWPVRCGPGGRFNARSTADGRFNARPKAESMRDQRPNQCEADARLDAAADHCGIAIRPVQAILTGPWQIGSVQVGPGRFRRLEPTTSIAIRTHRALSAGSVGTGFGSGRTPDRGGAQRFFGAACARGLPSPGRRSARGFRRPSCRAARRPRSTTNNCRGQSPRYVRDGTRWSVGRIESPRESQSRREILRRAAALGRCGRPESWVPSAHPDLPIRVRSATVLPRRWAPADHRWPPSSRTLPPSSRRAPAGRAGARRLSAASARTA